MTLPQPVRRAGVLRLWHRRRVLGRGHQARRERAVQDPDLVRRPLSNVRFTGPILVEWQNVTAGYDLDALWSRRRLVRDT